MLSTVGDTDPDAIRASATSARASPYFATARLWDDGVIDPRETRARARPLPARLAPRRRLSATRFGVFRM